jgi:site-specific DNA recombinase
MRRVVVAGSSRDILFGETPYGWRLSRDRSKLVVDDDERRVIAVVRHMYLVERIPMRAIVDRLRETGVVNRRGRPFGLSSIFEMIHRPANRPPEASGRRQRVRSRH